MSDDAPIFDFETRGYRFLAENSETQGEARIRIFKGLEIRREFTWPTYKVWNLQAHANDIIDGLESDKDTGLRMAGGTGFGGTAYGDRTLSERLFDAASVVERAIAHNEVTGNLAMPEDEDDPEGTLIVKMSDTIRKAMASLLRDAATDIQARNVTPRHECDAEQRAHDLATLLTRAQDETDEACRERDAFEADCALNPDPCTDRCCGGTTGEDLPCAMCGHAHVESSGSVRCFHLRMRDTQVAVERLMPPSKALRAMWGRWPNVSADEITKACAAYDAAIGD